MDQVKTKVATVWLGGCSGCHMSFLDLDEKLLDLAQRIDLVYSPILDIKVFPDVDVVLIEGAVVNHDHIDEIRHIRSKARILVAFGDCAVTGNVAGMRNPIPLASVIEASYGTVQPDAELPVLLKKAVPLQDIVTVDCYLPGCPPDAARIMDAVLSLLDNRPMAEPRRFG